MKPVRIEISKIVVVITEKRLIVAGRRRGSPHLTLFFEPQPSGKWAGRWRPHITFGRGKVWLGTIAPEAMAHFSKNIALDLRQRWAAATTPINLADFARENWRVYAPPEAGFVERLDRVFSAGERRYRVTEQRFEKFAVELADTFENDCISPLDLPRQDECVQQYVAFRVADGRVAENCWLSLRPDPSDGRGDWQMTRWDWLPPGGYNQILIVHAGEEFRRGCSRIATALRLHDPFAPGSVVAAGDREDS